MFETVLRQPLSVCTHISGFYTEKSEKLGCTKALHKRGDERNKGLYFTHPMPHCANNALYLDYTDMTKSEGYDLAVVVTCGLTTKETIKNLVQDCFRASGGPKEINSDDDVRVRSDTGWYKRVLRAPYIQISTGASFTHTSKPLYVHQSAFSRRKSEYGAKLSAPRTGRDYSALSP